MRPTEIEKRKKSRKNRMQLEIRESKTKLFTRMYSTLLPRRIITNRTQCETTGKQIE